MANPTKKLRIGKPYYYLRECKRVNGKPKIVRTVYLGSAESIEERRFRCSPKMVRYRQSSALIQPP